MLRFTLLVAPLAGVLAAFDASLPLPLSSHPLQHQPIPAKSKRALHQSRYGKTLMATPALDPLFPGYGTHFAYVYVGTPPQRQSVIIDTGSAYTGFPCASCVQCGQHTDPYFDPSASTSKTIPNCKGELCHLSMTYTEGSSWFAYAVVDTFYVGGIRAPTGPPPYAFANYFACQTSVTGLFESQLADGILGLAMMSTSMNYQMVTSAVASSKVFALCFRNGGGIFTVGGVDQRLNVGAIQYTKLIENPNGWYVTFLQDIGLKMPSGKVVQLNLPSTSTSKLDRLAVIDSGTTDSYLPASFFPMFAEYFQAIAGIAYTTDDMEMSDALLAKLPDIQLAFNDLAGKPFVVNMPVASYVEDVGNGMFGFRLFFTEDSGTILGANFMSGYNIIFDPDLLRMGFASSSCEYEDFTVEPDVDVPGFPNKAPAMPECLQYAECTAACTNLAAKENYLASGWQEVRDTCKGTKSTVACHVSCDTAGKEVRGVFSCPDSPWSECSSSCTQYRTTSDRSCKTQRESRTCTVGSCPVEEGDFVILLDLKVSIEPKKWSYVNSDVFILALEQLLNVSAGSIDLLNDASSEFSKEVRLHFQLHLRSKDSQDKLTFRANAELIPLIAGSSSFTPDFVQTINSLSIATDRIDFVRYGYLQEFDVSVLKAVSLPIGYSRDLDHRHNVLSGLSESETVILILVGVAVGCSVVLGVVCCFYCRLRAEHDAFSKDKVMGGSLRRMWERFQGMRQKRRDRNASARQPLMRPGRMEDDDQLDAEDVANIRV